jgi:hypothetical protein
MPEFFLTSNDYDALKPIRSCRVLKNIATRRRDDLVLVEVNPGIARSTYGIQNTVATEVILGGRHIGWPISPTGPWPQFVTVSVPDKSLGGSSVVEDEDLGFFLGIGVIFPSASAAQQASNQ